MIGTIPTYDPFLGDTLPPPMIVSNLNDARNGNNMDNLPNDQAYDGANRAAL